MANLGIWTRTEEPTAWPSGTSPPTAGQLPEASCAYPVRRYELPDLRR